MLLNVNCKKVTYGMDNPMFMAPATTFISRFTPWVLLYEGEPSGISITGNKLIASGAECNCGAIDCSHDWKGIVYRVLLCTKLVESTNA